MKFLSVSDIAKKWNISERSVRNYCALGKVKGAFLTSKTWNIPEDAVKPDRANKKAIPQKLFWKYCLLKKALKCQAVYITRFKLNLPTPLTI